MTPALAVTGPATGGQSEAHDPLQFDLVGVSGTNQYKVKPFALVSTAVLPIVVVFRAALMAALDVDGTDGLVEEVDELGEVAGFVGDELAHPAARSAAATRPGAAHRTPCACFGGRPVTPLPQWSVDIVFPRRLGT